ncbi:MAG TPA: hypothetical protein VNT52_09645, partial [Acidimicrobiales bacterium]|nr:hypothetical protein [Acidimicrobiales bacterium]
MLGAVGLVIGLVAGIEAPAMAVQAGQFCASAQAGAQTIADNGATVQCLYNSSSDRYHWVAVGVVIFEPTGPVGSAP